MAACDLVICHGGNGTIYQALQHGKPVIGIPTLADQKFNMRRVEALGLGKTLSWDKFLERPDFLIELIRMVLGNIIIYRNAEQLKIKVSTYNSVSVAADILTGM
jgi:UDP:flavonoid glycosyltransferase YjiC (YdhE family)